MAILVESGLNGHTSRERSVKHDDVVNGPGLAYPDLGTSGLVGGTNKLPTY